LFSFSNPGVSVSGGKTTETAILYGFTCEMKEFDFRIRAVENTTNKLS